MHVGQSGSLETQLSKFRTQKTKLNEETGFDGDRPAVPQGALESFEVPAISSRELFEFFAETMLPEHDRREFLSTDLSYAQIGEVKQITRYQAHVIQPEGNEALTHSSVRRAMREKAFGPDLFAFLIWLMRFKPQGSWSMLTDDAQLRSVILSKEDVPHEIADDGDVARCWIPSFSCFARADRSVFCRPELIGYAEYERIMTPARSFVGFRRVRS